jgi:lysyl-tRNA synthetase class II
LRLWLLSALVVCLPLAAASAQPDASASQNDYPTSARADYVLGCMASNNQTRTALEHCSCSIDVIASILPYDKYEEAETILSMRQAVGAQAREFNAVKSLNDIVADLRRAQAEAEIRCFH